MAGWVLSRISQFFFCASTISIAKPGFCW
jgi:hypothetical protein